MHNTLLGIALLAALGAAACSNSDAPTVAATPLLTQDTLPGTVAPPVNGTPQSTSVPFTVAAAGGSVVVTLTSAVETNADGTTNPNVVMGVGVGTPTGATCVLPPGSLPFLLQASASSSLSGTEPGGAYCVQVSDVTNQTGPVAFTIVISHP